MKIGIFDSGMGGLTVLKTLKSKYPNNHYIYYGDTLNLPYGTKTKEELLKCSTKVVHFLEEKQVDKIIIACGTVSSVLNGILPSKVPLIDLMNPTVIDLKKRGLRKVGIIATPMTIHSGVFMNKLEEQNIQVSAVACPKLVPLIEAGKQDTEEFEKILEKYLSQLDADIELLILGCTHYSLLKEPIERNLAVPTYQMETSILALLKDGKEAKTEFYFSKMDTTIQENIEKILK